MTRPPRTSSAATRLVCLPLVALCVLQTLPAATRPAERARHAMVVGPERLAVEAGLEVLRAGGNAVDAAVTIGFALAVTHPAAGNIGGGGFMLIRHPSGEATFIDYREVAPARATRDMFLDEQGEVIPGDSLSTYRAAGVPGTVAGLALALERHGSIPLSRALAPAIGLARDGFSVGRGLEEELSRGASTLGAHPASRAIFFKDGSPLAEGDRLVQSDLARTLERIARDSARGFYGGEIALAIENDMKAHGGLITRDDLAAYRPVVRKPLSAVYRGHEILSAPPSSSGGVALFQMLAMLEAHDLSSLGHNSSAYCHLVSEAMKRAFADRARWLGDPEFVTIPLAGLLSPAYAAARMQGFDPARATPVDSGEPDDPRWTEATQTTHFSILDEKGMAVANTYTLNDSFGSGAVAAGLGFLLNNEMDDFSIKPGVPNLYGLVGGEANSILPGKRMLSSMTPTIVMAKQENAPPRPYLILGTPGGSAIITSVLQVLLNVVDFDMEIQAAVDAPRFHHQWKPDRITVDPEGFPLDVTNALRSRGHEIVVGRRRGDVQAILVDEDGGWIRGASDARGHGAAKGY